MSSFSRESVEDAVKTGDIDELQRLTEQFGVATVRLDDNPHELTALHVAAAAGALKAVEFLLSPAVKADPSATRNNHFAPLHAAAMFGHAAVCGVLLRAGAEVNVQTDPQGYAPLHSAAYAGHVETIGVLLSHGANPNLANYRGEKPADTAKRQGQPEAQRLLESGLS